MRFVNAATFGARPARRPWTSPCELASITAVRPPPATWPASSAWSAATSGVVWEAARRSGPRAERRRCPAVPRTAGASSARSSSWPTRWHTDSSRRAGHHGDPQPIRGPSVDVGGDGAEHVRGARVEPERTPGEVDPPRLQRGRDGADASLGGDQRARGASLERLGQEASPVGPQPLQPREELTALDPRGLDPDPGGHLCAGRVARLRGPRTAGGAEGVEHAPVALHQRRHGHRAVHSLALLGPDHRCASTSSSRGSQGSSTSRKFGS